MFRGFALLLSQALIFYHLGSYAALPPLACSLPPSLRLLPPPPPPQLPPSSSSHVRNKQTAKVRHRLLPHVLLLQLETSVGPRQESAHMFGGDSIGVPIALFVLRPLGVSIIWLYSRTSIGVP